MQFLALDSGAHVNARFIVDIEADPTPSEDATTFWHKIAYQRGSEIVEAYALAADVASLLT